MKIPEAEIKEAVITERRLQSGGYRVEITEVTDPTQRNGVTESVAGDSRLRRHG